MSFFEWIDIQIQRFVVWLRARREYPNHEVFVRYGEDGKLRVILGTDHPDEVRRIKEERKQERQRIERLRSLMTPEERAADEAREEAALRRMVARCREDAREGK